MLDMASLIFKYITNISNTLVDFSTKLSLRDQRVNDDDSHTTNNDTYYY